MSRAPLTKERVLAAAIGIADEGGIDSLSMRRLAKELGVEAMSLYHYVSGKDDLLDGMVNAVLSEIEYPPPGEHWKAALRQIALSYRKSLAEHPWAARVMFARTDALSARTRYMETVLRTLSEAGLSAELTDLGYHAFEAHVMGYTLWAANISEALKGDLADLAASFLRRIPADEYPHLIQHIHHHLSPPTPARSAFEFGLDLVLDGLERLREEPSGARDMAPVRAAARRTRAERRPARRTRTKGTTIG